MGDIAKLRETARALEVVLSRLRLDSGTAHVLRGNLGSTRDLIDRLEATRPNTQTEQEP